MITFDEDIVTHVPPSAKHFNVVLHTLDRAKAERAGSLSAPVNKMAEHFKRRSILALISDFYEEPDAILEAIKPLRFLGNDLIVFHVLDPAEIDFEYDDASSFQDLESGEQIPVVPESLAEQYRALMQEHIDALTTKFSEQRIDYTISEHVAAARPRAVQLPVEPRKTDEGEVTRRNALPDTPLPPRPGGARDPGPRPPDPARAEARHRVPVADVRAADSLSVGAAPPHPSLVPAAAARRGDRADRRGVRAAVPAARRAGGRPSAAAREVVVLLDQSASMGYGDHWQQARQAARRAVDGLGNDDRATLVLFARNAEENIRATSDRGRLGRRSSAAKVGVRRDALRPGAEAGGEHPGRSSLKQQGSRC